MSDFNQTSLHEELEVRVIALLTGELKESEADELEKILAINPELSAFRDRMAELMGELHARRDEITCTDSEAPHQLSEERRAKIFGDPSVLDAKIKRKRPRLNAALWGVAASIAMVFFISLLGTVKFVNHVMHEEAFFEAVPIAAADQKELEYTVNLLKRSRTVKSTRPPAIVVNEIAELDIPTLDIDVTLDEDAVFARDGGEIGGFAKDSSDDLISLGAVAQSDRFDDRKGRHYGPGETIAVEIPEERIEGTPQRIPVPNLEPAPTQAPRMIVSDNKPKMSGERDFRQKNDINSSDLFAAFENSDVGGDRSVSVDSVSGYDKYNEAPLDGNKALSGEAKLKLRQPSGGVAVGSIKSGITSADFGYAAEGFANAGGKIKEAESLPRTRDQNGDVPDEGNVASSGPVNPFAAPASPSVNGNYRSNVDPFAAPVASRPKSQVSAERKSEVFEEISGLDLGDSEARLSESSINSIEDEGGDVKSREKMLRQVDQSWERPKVFEVASESEAVASSALVHKPEVIVIPQVNFSGMPLSRVVETIEELSAVYDPEGTGVQIEYQPVDGHDPKVNISLRNLNVGRILEFVTQQVNYSYDVGAETIKIQPRSGLAGVAKYSTEFIPIKREMLIRLLGDRYGAGKENEALNSFFETAGINSELPGSSLAFDGEQLIVTQTRRNIERIRAFLRHHEGLNQAAQGTAQNVRLTPKPEKLAAEEPFSTFSLNISDVSFKLAQAALANSRVPPAAQIRTEEFVNSFDYGDPIPRADEPVGLNWEIAQHPFEHGRQVIRFSLQTQASGRESGQPLNLSLLVDNSGSMQRADRQAILQDSLQTLQQKLKPGDKLNIVLFARQPRLIAEAQTRATQKAAVEAALAYRPEGGTNIEAGLKAAYESARRNFVSGGSNRVILLTDGAANLGNINAGELAEYVVDQRKQGIALDAYGIGWDDYNDALLEQITRNGDGRYAFLNSVEDASEDFSEKLAGTLQVAASNVKVQVEWNPDRVKRYRQIGYDLHQLKKEDFRDNTVDAAEVAVAESGTALYVLQIDDDPEIIGGLGTLHVRYLDPASGLYRERSWALAMPHQVPAANVAEPSMRLAMSSAFFGERLANSPFAGGYNFNDLYTMTSGLPEAFPNQPRVSQMQTMLHQASELYGEK